MLPLQLHPMSGKDSSSSTSSAGTAAPTSAITSGIPGAVEELPKQYRPAEHEPRVWDAWMGAKAFHADPSRVARGEAKPYCVLIPPPNVTAALHLGHALNNTLQDMLVRVHRMRGFETLWMPGTDHAGIATQAVVEKRVQKEENKRRTDFTREAFIAKIQAFKDEYEATITNQLKKMGCSCDWDRQRFTMDPVCASAVREAFFRLFADGLIYRGKRLVNWDPALQTAVADDECIEEDLDAAFYYLRYPLVHPHGASTSGERKRGELPPSDAVPVTWSELARRGYEGAETHPDEEQAWITVATTRPETYLADTAVALNPHDPRAKALTGLCVELPLVGRIIPIVTDDYVVLPKAMARNDDEANDPKAEYATGFLKVTPGHDANDYDLYQRHKEHMDTFAGGLDRALINMMSPDGRVSDKHGWSDVGDAHMLVGKKMAEARKHVVEEFKSRGLLESQRPYRHSVKHSDRSKAIIEPYLSDQWYVKVTDARLAASANDALAPEQRSSTKAGSETHRTTANTLRFFPARYAKTFEYWHDNIRDWCISRQLWWGHRIPVWTKHSVSSHEVDSLAGVVKSAADVSLTKTADNNGTYSVHVCVKDPASAVIAHLEGAGLTQDPDVLDTWFSSALWPISTMGWPNPQAAGPEFKGLLEAFNPSSSLSTAREIITLWVSRMVMMNRYFMGDGHGRGPVPFHEVMIHAVIQDGKGQKMSKSLGNGVDPLDIIQSHGADAMRYTMCQMATQTQDVRLPVVKDSVSGKNTSPKFDAGRNFANKVWNAARFTLGMVAQGAEDKQGSGQPTLADRWMLSRLRGAIVRIDEAIKNYEFSEYALALYDVFWRDFCDWYLEAVKPTAATNAAQRAILVDVLSSMVRLLHPVMPFMTEAVWEKISKIPHGTTAGLKLHKPRVGGLLCSAGWPVADAALHDESAEKEFARLQALVTFVREARSAHTVAPKKKVRLHVPDAIAGFVKEHAVLLITYCTLESIETGAVTARDAVTFTFDALEFAISGLHEATEGAPAPGANAHAGGGVLTQDGGGLGAASPSGDNSQGNAQLSETEHAHLSKRKTDLMKEISTYEGRLANPGYALKAPPSMVEETKEKLRKAKDELAAVEKRLR